MIHGTSGVARNVLEALPDLLVLASCFISDRHPRDLVAIPLKRPADLSIVVPEYSDPIVDRVSKTIKF